MTRPSAVLVALCCLTTVGGAQASGKASRCPMPDTSRAWYTKQKLWMDESGQKWSNDSLRNVLISAAEQMEAALPAGERVAVVTFLPVLGWRMMDGATQPTPADSAAIAVVRSMGRGSQPTRSAIGSAGVRAIWLIAQRDSMLERSMVRRMMEAGLDESMQPFVASMEDRVRVRAGRPQMYGTLLQSLGGKVAPLRIEDSAHADLRREGAWLPPLAQAVCAAQAAHP